MNQILENKSKKRERHKFDYSENILEKNYISFIYESGMREALLGKIFLTLFLKSISLYLSL